MASQRFKKVLAIRFSAYLVFWIGILATFFQFGPVLGSEFSYRKDQFLGVKHTLTPTVITSGGQVSPSSPPDDKGGFGQILNLTPLSITPVSTDYGIVIEKINANAKVIGQVDPGDEPAYTAALAQGVVEAKGSTRPGEAGNVYIFSHSTDAAWNIARFNAVFYLLRELGPGDRIVLFFEGRRFDYIVFDKQIVSPGDLTFLQNRYDQPVLTLQTCDPPGTLLNRLIVRAKLEGR